MKPKHGAGKTKKSRCSIKNAGGGKDCDCGMKGHKMIRIPKHLSKDTYYGLPSWIPVVQSPYEYYYKRNKKWIKKRGIDIIKKVKKKLG